MTEKKASLGGRVWVSAVLFGLIGQIAWVVENMYFATFAQDIFANSGRGDLSYVITTLMVIFSALTATVTTIVAGGLSDKLGKRKPFVAIGYIVWGLTIMLFALIPMRVSATGIVTVGVFLVAFDCLMTVAGSASNDAAFNAWVADNTDSVNRGKLNAVLAILPVIAVVVVFIGLGGLYNSAKESNSLFFIILGVIPIVVGGIALFLLKDAPNVKKFENGLSAKEFFAGFRPSYIKENKMFYICLLAACFIGIAQQTFFSYLINFLVVTLGLGDGFVIPMAIIIVLAAVLTGASGWLTDKLGRKHFYIPLLLTAIVGIVVFYLLQFLDGIAKTLAIYIGGTLMMGGILGLTGLFQATFQDYIPSGAEGRSQGVRMCFTVLIPMIVGPIISLAIGLNAMGLNGAEFMPPYSIFLAAAIVAVLTIVPIIFIRKDAERLKKAKEEKDA